MLKLWSTFVKQKVNVIIKMIIEYGFSNTSYVITPTICYITLYNI